MEFFDRPRSEFQYSGRHPLKEKEESKLAVKKRTKTYRLGIMGGTFNPIHYGHLVAAEQARSSFKLQEVVFVPSGIPPHKDVSHVIDPEHRYLITVLATAANPHFSVSRAEIDRKGPSFAIDTIKYFLDLYKARNPDVYFITGMDAVMEILSWKRPDRIMKLCTIIAATRPGYNKERLRKVLGPENFKAVKTLQVSALAISSTDIRLRVAAGLPIKYLLPDSVENYIEKNGLYIDREV